MRSPEEDPRYARMAAEALACRAADNANTAAGALPDRTATIAALQRELRARGRRRLLPWVGAGVAAAAAVLLWLGWRSAGSPDIATKAGPVHGAPAPVVAGAAPAPVVVGLAVAGVDGSGTSIETADGVRVAARGDRIAAGATVGVSGPGHLLLALDTGTRLRVGAASRARVTALGQFQRFDLESGTLEAEVAKLPLGGRFVIATHDAEVEVRGTRFEVAVVPEGSSCAPFVHTQVAVQEGVVAIRFAGGEARVAAGSVWPVCAAPAGAAPARSHAHPARTPARTTAAVAAPPQPDPSTLAEQNDLFAAALAARRRGDVADAIRWLDRLIARYPTGQLVDSARAERQRLIETGGGKAPSE
jgi:hypothetical protein